MGDTNIGGLQAKVTLDIAEYEANIRRMQAQLVELRAEFGAADAGVKDFANHMADYSRRTVQSIANMGKEVDAEFAKMQQARFRTAFNMDKDAEKRQREIFDRDLSQVIAVEKAETEAAAASILAKRTVMAEQDKLAAMAVAGARAQAQARIEEEARADAVTIGLFKARLKEEEAAEAASAAKRALIRRELVQAGYLTGGYEGGRAANLLTGTGTAGTSNMAVGIGAAVGIVAASAALLKFTEDAAQAARGTENLAQELGLSWNNMRNLQEEAKLAGVQITTLQQASWRLAAAMEGTQAGSTQVVRALKDIGIEGASSSGDLLLQVLNHLAQIPDATKRIAEAHVIMGRASYQIIPLIQNYESLQYVIKQLGPQLDTELKQRLEGAAVASSALRVEWDRMKASIAAPDFVIAGSIALIYLMRTIKFLSEGVDKEKEKRTQAARDMAVIADKEAALELARNTKSAVERNAVFEKSLEGLKFLLKKANEEISVQQEALLRKINPLNPKDAAAANATLNHALAERKRLTNEIAEVEAAQPKEQFRIQSRDIDAEIQHKQRVLAMQKTIIEEGIKEREMELQETTEAFNRKKNITDAELTEQTRYVAGSMAQRLAAIQDLKTANNQEYDDAYAAAYKKANLEKAAGAQRIEAEHNLTNQLQEIFDKWLERDIDASKRQELVRADAAKRVGEATIKARQQALDREHSIVESAINWDRRRIDDESRAENTRLDTKRRNSAAEMDLERNAAEFAEQRGNITKARRIAIDRAILEAQYQMEKKAIDNEIANLQERADINEHVEDQIARKEEQLQQLHRRHEAEKQALNQEELKGLSDIDIAVNNQIATWKRLKLEGDLNERVVQLEYLKIKTDALRISQEGLGGVWVHTLQAASRGWSQLSDAVATGILDSKNFNQAWHSALHSIEQQIISSTVEAVLKLAASWVLGKVAVSDYTKDVILGTVAVGTASKAAATVQVTAAATATRSITFLHRAMANAVIEDYAEMTAAAKAYCEAACCQCGGGNGGGFDWLGDIIGSVGGGLLGGFGSLFGGGSGGGGGTSVNSVIHFAGGGDMQRDGLAYLERGEHVLNPDISERLRKTLVDNPGGGSTRITLDFSGAVFHGVPSKELIDPFMDRVVRELRSAKVLTKKL